ncbi:hypothetical protein [Paracoccus denitrificans]|uniref:hypothetical protein n=1 Tax=Paracoccus denitrificans TaxID=266 RepID=UPI000CEC98D6|nr:hypothetical protein [Paracoccus denitrificans]
MSQNILITGPSLAPAAADVLTRAGYVPIYVPPYVSGDGLIEVVRMADPVGILARMGRIDETVFASARSAKRPSRRKRLEIATTGGASGRSAFRRLGQGP